MARPSSERAGDAGPPSVVFPSHDGYKAAALRRWESTGDDGHDAHGGYLVRVESFRGLDVAGLARACLALEGVATRGVSLHVTTHPKRKVVRLAYKGGAIPTGSAGARWHSEHQQLAGQLSLRCGAAVQAYALVAGAFEEVVSYGDGRRVGGERLEYADVDLPEEAMVDDEAFAKLQRTWPLGHLAHVFGLTRELLLGLAGLRGLSIPLDGREGREDLDSLLPGPAPHLRLG